MRQGMSVSILLLLLVSFTLTASATVDVPRLVNYQGVLQSVCSPAAQSGQIWRSNQEAVSGGESEEKNWHCRNG